MTVPALAPIAITTVQQYAISVGEDALLTMATIVTAQSLPDLRSDSLTVLQAACLGRAASAAPYVPLGPTLLGLTIL